MTTLSSVVSPLTELSPNTLYVFSVLCRLFKRLTFFQVSYVHHVTPIPEGYDSKDAASILCAVSHRFHCEIEHTLMSPFHRVLPYTVPSSTPRPAQVTGWFSPVLEVDLDILVRYTNSTRNSKINLTFNSHPIRQGPRSPCYCHWLVHTSYLTEQALTSFISFRHWCR